MLDDSVLRKIKSDDLKKRFIYARSFLLEQIVSFSGYDPKSGGKGCCGILPFRWNGKTEINISDMIATKQDGGLGLHIIEACIDKLVYYRDDDRNILTLFKNHPCMDETQDYTLSPRIPFVQAPHPASQRTAQTHHIDWEYLVCQ